MTIEIGILFLIILALIVVLATETLPPATLAVTVMVVLMVGGFVTPEQGVSGFSNTATTTILALMILSVGLETTGVITEMGKRIKGWLQGGEQKAVLLLMLMVGVFSAFISTTAVVIVFMRIVIKFAKKITAPLSGLLMPLSFAGILGGSCTLLGTSTNLIVSSAATENGLPAFGIFEFSHIGLIFFVAGTLYMVFLGRHLMPNRKQEEGELTVEYDIYHYLTEVMVPEGSPLVGTRIDQSVFFEDEEIDLIEIKRDGVNAHFPNEVDSFQKGDVLLVKGELERIAALRRMNGLYLLSRQSVKDDERMNTDDMTLCEVVVRPNSSLVGRQLNKVDVKRDYNAIPLAVKKRQEYHTKDLEGLKIEPGDTLLMEVGKSNFERFYNLHEFVVLQEHEELASRSGKRYLAAAIVVAVVVGAALKILPILTSAWAGCVLMFLTGCLDLQTAYRRVDWGVIFLLAGVIPLGTAMNNTGADTLLAQTFVDQLGEVQPRIVVAALFFITAALSAIVSNNATAILLAPIAISIATNLGLDPRPLLFTVMFAANMSFVSPLGYQTNTLIYGAGEYRFMDFVKAGGGLTLLIWGLATWLIPAIYF